MRGTVTLVLALVVLGQVQAQEARLPVFDLVTNGGVTATGLLDQISADWSMGVAGAPTPGLVPGKKIVALRGVKVPLPACPTSAHVVLANGDQLPGRARQVKNERLEFECSFEDHSAESPPQVLNFALDEVALLWWSAPEGEGDGELFARRLRGERRRQDVLWLRNGDRIEGNLAELTPDVVRMEEAGGRRATISVDKAAVIALNTELARLVRPRDLFGRLILTNGARLSLASAQADSRTLVGKTFQGKEVRISVDRIATIDMLGGCAVYLSDLKPSHYEHRSYLGLSWPFARDASVAGRQIRLGGSFYDKGIGMHSESRLQFDLDGTYEWFEALVGLDERTGSKGNVEVELHLDGKKQDIGKAELAGRDLPRPVRVHVQGSRTLTLVAKFGRGGDVQDHLDWAQARLLKPVP
jgi:hypothetical protein